MFAPLLLAALAAPPDARPLLSTYCFECHSGTTRRGGLALDQLLADPAADRRTWEKVWKSVRHEFMPPADADPLPPADRRAISRWVERAAFQADPRRPDPGRVTIRRLNRMEYRFTIRDLFGIDFDPSQELPPDDTAFGFDNIGDAQTVSPALLNTYLTLAEKVVAEVVVENGPQPPRRELRPDRFRFKGDDPKTGRAETAAAVEVKHAGRYRVELEFRVGGWHDFGGEYTLTATLGGEPVAKTVLVNGGEKKIVLSGEVTLPAGQHELRVVTAATGGRGQPFPISPRAVITGPLEGTANEYPPAHARLFFNGPPPADATARREYARAILAKLAAKAFRRPADPATLDRLTALALSAPRFETGIAQAVTAILTSPRFFYRAEPQPAPNDPAAVHPLDDFALASRLSHLLWLSVPDERLTALAAAGKLRGELPAEVRRMLADPKAGRFVEDFGGQWLRTRNVLLTPVTFKDMGWIDPLRPLMKRETDMLFEYVVREDRDLAELLTADYTFLNQRLAEHYGIKGVTGDEFRKVQLPADGRRAGLLTHAGTLLATSNPNRTSPVKRGLFVLENLLGREVPPPPPNVGDLDSAKGKDGEPKTLREQLAAHREQKSCAACHAHFDPIGLALEHYDTTGRWRDTDNGQPVDSKTELVSGEAIGGAADLTRALAARKDVFYRCVTEKLLTYALGRGLDPTDAATVDALAERLAAGGGKFSVLLAGVTESHAFQARRGDAGEARALQRPPDLKRKPPVHKIDRPDD